MAAFAAGTIVYQAGRLALTLIAAAVLGPENFGDWVLISLLIVYVSATGLGVTNGAGREIPFLAGGGRTRDAKDVADAASAATIVSGAAAAALSVLLAALILEGRLDGLVLLLLAVAAALQHPFLLEQVLYRSWFAFQAAATQLIVLGLVVLVTGVALVAYGIPGLLVSQVLTYGAAVGLGIRLLPYTPRPRWNPVILRALISVGFPIMVAGLLYGLLTTIDRWLVATFMDRAAVGHYGLVGIVTSGLLLIPQMLAQHFYPRMAFAHGGGSTHAELVQLARSQGIVAGLAVGGLAIGTAVIAYAVVPIALPAYVASLLPLALALVGVVAYAFGSGYGNVLNTVGAHRRFLTIQAVALLGTVGLATVLLAAGWGLEGVAFASTVGLSLCSIMLFRTATGGS